MKTNIIEVTEADFEREVLGVNGVVVVAFWASWSDVCKTMTPLLESVAENGDGAVKVTRVKVEHQRALAEKYGVGAIPTLLIFNQGNLEDEIVGRFDEEELRNRLACFA